MKNQMEVILHDNDENVSSSTKNKINAGKSPPKKLSFRNNETENQDNDEVLEIEARNEGEEISGSSNQTKATFTVEELTSDDEIYMFQCPKNFFKPDLFNKNIDLSIISKITSKGEDYQVELVSTNKNSLTLAVPTKTKGASLVNLPLKGNIVIQKVVNTSDCKTVLRKDDSEENKVVFPNDIKERHPLLGVEWKAHIKLADEAFNNGGLKKKKHGETEESVYNDLEIIETKLKRKRSESDFTPFKEKKKRKIH